MLLSSTRLAIVLKASATLLSDVMSHSIVVTFSGVVLLYAEESTVSRLEASNGAYSSAT